MKLKKYIANIIYLLFYSNICFCQELTLNDISIKKSLDRHNEFLAYKINDENPFTGVIIDRSGFIRIKFVYKNGKLNGLKETFKDEIKIEECNYIENKRNGIFYQYYDSNILEIKGQFKDDKEVGQWEAYYKNGKMKYVGKYMEGKKENNWKYFNESGSINRVDFYSKGIFIKSILYQNGKKVEGSISISELSTKIENGKKRYLNKDSNSPFYGLAYEFVEDSVSKLKKEFEIQNGLPYGRWSIFYDNGMIKATGFYNQDGLVEGSYTEYYKNGKLSCEGEYKKGLKNGSWTFYTEAGYYYLIGTMIDDIKHSVWRYFDEKGKLVKEELYIFGVKQN